MGRLAQHLRDKRHPALPSSAGSVSVGGASCEFDPQGGVRCNFEQGSGSNHKLDAGCYVNTGTGLWHCPGVPQLHGKPAQINRLSNDAPWADIEAGIQVPAFPVSVGARRRSKRFKDMRHRKHRTRSDFGTCIARCVTAHAPGSAAFRNCMKRCYTGPELNPSLPTGIVRGFGRRNPSIPTGVAHDQGRWMNRHRLRNQPAATDVLTAPPPPPPPPPPGAAPDCCIDEATGLITCVGGKEAFYMHGETVNMDYVQCEDRPEGRVCSLSAGGDVFYDIPVCPSEIPPPDIGAVPIPEPPPECCVDAETSTLQNCTPPEYNGTPVQIMDVDEASGTVMVAVPWSSALVSLPLCPERPPEEPPECCVDAETSTLQNCMPPEYNGTPVQIIDVDEGSGTVMVGVPWSSTPIRLPLCEKPPIYIPPEDCPPCPEPRPCPPPEEFPPGCPPGQWTAPDGSCVTCPPGFLIDPASGQCVECPSPEECPPQRACPTCPPGFLLDTATGQCVQCPGLIPPGPTPCGEAPCPTPPGMYPPPPGSGMPPGECPPDGPCPVPGAAYPPPPGSALPQACCENGAMGLPCPHQ